MPDEQIQPPDDIHVSVEKDDSLEADMRRRLEKIIRTTGQKHAVERLLDEFQLYVMAEGAEQILRGRKARHEAASASSTDKADIATHAIRACMIDMLLTNNFLDYIETLNVAKNDPRCSWMDEESTKECYKKYRDTLRMFALITPDTNAYDELPSDNA